MGLTIYRIVYEMSNRIKSVDIWAASPLLALNKWKEMMPKLIYKNSLLHNIEEVIEEKIIQKKRDKYTKLCFPNHFEIKKAI